MVVEQCTKCGVKGCPELFGQTSEWRDVIPNDELCDSCRDDVEWRKDNVLVPLSDQVVKAAHFGEREILNRLVDQGAPLSGALSGVEMRSSVVTSGSPRLLRCVSNSEMSRAIRKFWTSCFAGTLTVTPLWFVKRTAATTVSYQLGAFTARRRFSWLRSSRIRGLRIVSGSATSVDVRGAERLSKSAQ